MPRISEAEWEERFGWLPNDDGDRELLNDTRVVRQLLTHHDDRYIWSQLGEPDGDGSLIVPGFRSHANGWYLCERAWDPAHMVAAVTD